MKLSEHSPTSSRPSSSVGGIRRNHEPHPEGANSTTNLCQHKSVSSTTLQPTIIQPRMAQLETLEAKMASIEVSLSSTPRRKKNGSIAGVGIASSIRSIPKELVVKELDNLRNALKDKENIIQSLRGQLTLPGLRLTAMRGNNNNNIKELSEVEKKQAEDRLNRLKTDVDNKRLAIKNLKMALERLDITDNIDVRIQQAELEYQLGREELNLLTLLEETRALQMCIEESNKASADSHTLYSCVDASEYVILQAVEIEHDPKSPKFGAGQKDSVAGLYIDWALEDTNLRKGDRLIEVNGKIVLNRNREDLTRLLAAAPDPAQIVLLRKISQKDSLIFTNTTSRETQALRTELESVREKADEAQKAKDVLRSDNIRLTHRISYLEEQVSDLMSRRPPDQDCRLLPTAPVISKSTQNVTHINIRTQSPANSTSTNSEAQAFQKGSLVAAMRSKSSLSNVSNTHIPAPEHHCQKSHSKHKHRSSRSGVQSPVSNGSLHQEVSHRKNGHHHHHHHNREKDYSSETNSTVEQVKRLNRRNHDNLRTSSDKEYASDVMDQSYKKATKIVNDLTRPKDASLYEKHRQKCITASEQYNADILRHYNARKSTSVLDFRSEVHIGPKYDSKSVEELDTNRVYRRPADSRSVKSLDFDSDCNSTSTSCRVDYASEPGSDPKKLPYYPNGYDVKQRPLPPKKPLRLSLHKTHIVQTDPESQRRSERKRNHKGQMPAAEQNGNVNGHREQQVKWNYRRSVDSALENGSWC